MIVPSREGVKPGEMLKFVPDLNILEGEKDQDVNLSFLFECRACLGNFGYSVNRGVDVSMFFRLFKIREERVYNHL
jgi:hypothetical protein